MDSQQCEKQRGLTPKAEEKTMYLEIFNIIYNDQLSCLLSGNKQTKMGLN